MKLLVLALCVCAASAATFPRPTSSSYSAKPWQSKATFQAKPTVTVQTYASAQPSFAKASPTFAPARAPTTVQFFEVSPTFAPEPAKLRLPAPTFAPTYYPEPAKTRLTSFAKDTEAETISDENKITEDGFSYKYQTNNGLNAFATGTLKKQSTGDFIAIEGQYEYPGVNGEPVVVSYTADENGYHPRGDILPTPPPTPRFVELLIEYLKEHAVPENQS